MYHELRWISLKNSTGYRGLNAQIEAELKDMVLMEMEPFYNAVRTRDYAAALTALDAFRVLCAHRGGPLGVNGMNQTIERWLAHAGYISTQSPDYVGRPILIRKNDSEQELYNGDGFIGEDDAYGTVAILPPLVMRDSPRATVLLTKRCMR